MAETALVTCATESEGLLSLELRRMLPDCELEWIADGIVALRSDMPFAGMSALFDREGCVFARHLAPAQWFVPPDGSIDAVLDRAGHACSCLPPGRPWRIQVRAPGRAWADQSLIAAVEDRAREAMGGAWGRSDPEAVVSVVATDGGAYIGVAEVSQCRSSWPGGARRYRNDQIRVSRSEFKLLEAIKVFGVNVPNEGVAVDLGASPGGWTRLLLDRGLAVFAVDPAKLDPRLCGARNLTVVRATAEAYLGSAPVCDVLTNDMRLWAPVSANIAASYADRLRPGGVSIVTLKLPERGVTSRDMLDLVRRCTETLRRRYAVLGVRQLFHNRSEVTVAAASPVAEP
ncbi:MAG: cell division protein FtsJ [Armatimonadetes bacterium]|nr:cell division protein FtsJ [Armatimonadota bacterium]